MKKTYLITFKVYEAAMTSEVPFMVPPEMLKGDRLKVTGMAVEVEMKLTEAEFNEICFWCWETSIMKMIGSTVQIVDSNTNALV